MLGNISDDRLTAAKTIRVHREVTVFPSRSAQRQQISLSALDLTLLMVHYDQKGLLYETPSHGFSSAVNLLEKSLSRVLEYFYPLAGRLTTSPSDGAIYINCNDAGAAFLEASAENVTVADVAAAEVTPAVNQLFPLNGAVDIEGHRLPLLAVQITKLRDGMFVGCSINHVVVDGAALWHFFNSWAEISRGAAPTISVNPVLDRRALSPRPPVRLNLDPGADCRTFSPPPLRIKMFHFSVDVLKGLKTIANQLSQVPISSLQALSGHVWQAVTRARRLSPEDSTTFQLSMDCRSKVVPPMPSSYFGNGIQTLKVASTASEVASNDISCPALLLHNVIQSHGHASFKERIDGWEKDPKLIRLETIAVTANVLQLGSSPRFPIYKTNFGWGKPVAVRSGCGNKFDGKIHAYPGKEGDGSVELEICLDPNTMDALEIDQRFLNPLLHGELAINNTSRMQRHP